MPFNGSGVYTPPNADFPAVPTTIIQSSKYNNVINDIALGISNCLTRDGQGGMLANVPMGGFQLFALGPATMGSHAVRMDQIQKGLAIWSIAGGTADVITAACTPVNIALTDGMLMGFRSIAPNATTTPTFNLDALGAHPITRNSGAFLTPGDIGRAGTEHLLRYNQTLTRWELLNPVASMNPTIRVISTSLTYTPPVHLRFAIVELVGGGGGGAVGAAATGGGGGGAGGYGRAVLTAAQIGSSQAVSIGAGTSTTGGTSSFGALLSAAGGTAGSDGSSGGTGGGGSAPGGEVRIGENGHTGNVSCGGNGGNSLCGPGGRSSNGATAGENGYSFGGGGGGGGPTSSVPSSGFSGVCILTEFYL